MDGPVEPIVDGTVRIVHNRFKTGRPYHTDAAKTPEVPVSSVSHTSAETFDVLFLVSVSAEKDT